MSHVRKARTCGRATRFTYMLFPHYALQMISNSLALVLDSAPSDSLRACPEPAEGTGIKFSTKVLTPV